MDNARARELIAAERAEVRDQLADLSVDEKQDRATEREQGDSGDAAGALASEGVDDAVAAGLQDRLAALDRADKRLDDGTYGVSIDSGAPIPAERLEADPAAELTVEEAAAAER